MRLFTSMAILGSTTLLACGPMGNGDGKDGRDGGYDGGMGDGGGDGTDGSDGDPGPDEEMGGLVFAMTNAADGNEVIALEHTEDGFEHLGTYSTGGLGLGTTELPMLEMMDGIDPLVSEASLVKAGHYLLAANAGSGDVSFFSVSEDGTLELMDKEHVGAYPNSIAVHEDLVFVALSGGPDQESGIAILEMSEHGELEHTGEVLSLSAPDAHPARVLVAGDGRFLVVTEVMTGAINVWPLEHYGMPGERVKSTSAGPGPFGAAAFGEDMLLVSEAAPMMPGQSSVSTYRIEDDGWLTPISAAVGNGQTANCWVQVTPDEMFAFSTNTESGTLSRYHLYEDGMVSVLEGAADMPGYAPIDLSLDGEGRFLYALLGASGHIAVWEVMEDGTIESRGTKEDLGLPELGSQGIVAW